MTVVVAAALFCMGLYGMLVRRDLVAILASVEVMIGGALVLLVGLAGSVANPARVEAIALIVIVVAAAEAAVGLALLVSVARRSRTTRIDDLTEVKG